MLDHSASTRPTTSSPVFPRSADGSVPMVWPMIGMLAIAESMMRACRAGQRCRTNPRMVVSTNTMGNTDRNPKYAVSAALRPVRCRPYASIARTARSTTTELRRTRTTRGRSIHDSSATAGHATGRS